ncbi:MAG TPA: hypothetical protein VNX29_01965 [Kaistia sp.]|nr:hypothetical protein [Kaistia sp.]
MTLLDQLRLVSTTYCSAVGRSRARVATLIFDHGAKFDLIDQGRDIHTRTFEKALAWFFAHWPEGLAWPEGVLVPAEEDVAAERKSLPPHIEEEA